MSVIFHSLHLSFLFFCISLSLFCIWLRKIICIFFDLFNNKFFFLRFLSHFIIKLLCVMDYFLLFILQILFLDLFSLLFLSIRFSSIFILWFFISLLSFEFPSFVFEAKHFHLEFKFLICSPSHYGHVYYDVEGGDANH